LVDATIGQRDFPHDGALVLGDRRRSGHGLRTQRAKASIISPRIDEAAKALFRKEAVERTWKRGNEPIPV
jgi:hypothetical protein